MVETIRLESGHTLTGIGGSNPSLSATLEALGLTGHAKCCEAPATFLGHLLAFCCRAEGVRSEDLGAKPRRSLPWRPPSAFTPALR